MNAIVVTNSTAEEIAALVVGLQGRRFEEQKSTGPITYEHFLDSIRVPRPPWITVSQTAVAWRVWWGKMRKGVKKVIIVIIVLVIAVVVCAIGWISSNIAVGALVQYIAEKGYTPPTPEELRACIWKVIREKFSRKS